MKTFSANLIAALEDEEATGIVLLDMQFATTLRYSNAEIPWYDASSNLYTPAAIDFGAVNYAPSGAVDTMKIGFPNIDLGMSAVVLGQDVIGKTVIVTVVILDTTDFAVVDTFESFRGIVDDWALDEDQVTFDLVNELILWRKETLRTASSSCPWPFKGDECGYSGGETACDRTYNRCTALGNTDNFGGFRFLPSIMEKDIWWGRVPGV